MDMNASVMQEILSRLNLICDFVTDTQGGTYNVIYSLLQLLDLSDQHRASAVYISPGSVPSLRINGQINLMNSAPLTVADCRKLLSPILTPELLTKLYGCGQAETFVTGSKSGFKVYLNLNMGNVCATFHRLRDDIPKLTNLGLSGKLIEGILSSPGLVLITGLPRSGKINTLASMISHINVTRQARIITLEKPIQFWHRNKSSVVIQREVGTDVPSFSVGIEQTVKQELDVLGVDEITDRETLVQVVRAATSGRLVLAVLDATSASQALERLVGSLNVDGYQNLIPMLASSLRLVLHQTLVERTDGRGVTPAFEILANNDAISNEIVQNRINAEQIDEIMRSHNMQTLDHSLGRLVASGIVSEQEASKYLKAPLDLSAASYSNNKQSQTGINVMTEDTILEDTDTPMMSWL